MKARLEGRGLHRRAERTSSCRRSGPRTAIWSRVLPGTMPKLKPVLLLAHIDVVEAKREDWERDPFKLVEEDGFFYGARLGRRQVHGGGVRRLDGPLRSERLPAGARRSSWR